MNYQMDCKKTPDSGRTSRSGGSPVYGVPHRTDLPLGWDSRGRNTASLVFLVFPLLLIARFLKLISILSRDFH